MELHTFKIKVIPLREKLLAYTSKLAAGQTEPEDIVQDVFLKLWSVRERLDEYLSVEALAMTMAKNKVFDELKRQRTESIDNIEWPDLNGGDATLDPETIAIQKDLANHVKRLIEALPALQQTIIRMKDVEGYELSEIAAFTGTPNEAVRVNLSRARKRIREQLIQLNNVRQTDTR